MRGCFSDSKPLFLWERLRNANKPVVLYGMGDGADKVWTLCQQYRVPVAGVFANDEFVRGQCYRGFPVRRLAELEEALGEMIVLLCFATHRPPVMEQILAVAARHELYAPDLPVAGQGLFSPAFVRAHRRELEQAAALLADDRSRFVLEQLIAYKLTGKVAHLTSCATPKSEAWALLSPGTGEFFVDAGAYTGDTVAEFLAQTGGRFREIVALEPDRRNHAKLERFLAGLDGSWECLPVGAWDRREALPFAQTSGRKAALSKKGCAGEITLFDSLDRLLEGRCPTFIKYDVEGAEARALKGSRGIISRCAPKLMLSAYHRNEDLFHLPLLVHGFHSGYRFYLRHHPCLPGWDINLYGIVQP